MRLGKKLRVLRASVAINNKTCTLLWKRRRGWKEKGEGGGEGGKGEEEERGGRRRKNTVFEARASLLKFWLGTVIILN